MKVNICQFNYNTLAIEKNKDKIKDVLLQNEDDVLNIFSEMSLCGSPLYKKSLYNNIYKETSSAGDELCNTNKSFIIGTCVKNEENYYNGLVFVDKGEVKALATKRNTGRFDTEFSLGNGIEVLNYGDKKIAFGFYGDIFNFYQRKVAVDVIILCGDYLFDKDYQNDIEKELSDYAKKLRTTIIYVNRIGAEGNYLFQGGSFVMNNDGQVIQKLSEFEEQTQIVTIQEDNTSNQISNITNPISNLPYEERIFNACVLGIRDYWRKSGIKKAVVGLSGGIDSALVAPLGVAALGKENVVGILMPSEFSSSHSVNDATQSAENLGIKHYTVPVQGIFEASKQALSDIGLLTLDIGGSDNSSMQPDMKDKSNIVQDTTEENLQARARCMIVMAFGNRLSAAMLNTSNKSESAVGYGTLYGDDSGALGPIGDLYKEDVYKLARWINKAHKEGKLRRYFDCKEEYLIPLSSIEKAPSAELHPNQKDSDTLPEYDVLDKILKDHIENLMDEKELVEKGYEENTVKKVMRLYRINEWKRRQEAPALRLSKTCFATDFKINY